MNNIIGTFVGFDGRINRQKWWIGVVILIIVAFVLNWIVGLVMGNGGLSLSQMMDPATMQKLGWQNLIVGIVLTYPYLALSMKRRHDRDNNGYDAAGLIILSLISNLLTALGLMGGNIGMIVSLVIGIFGIYILIQLGFLKGTAGPNSYGPDPLMG